MQRPWSQPRCERHFLRFRQFEVIVFGVCGGGLQGEALPVVASSCILRNRVVKKALAPLIINR